MEDGAEEGIWQGGGVELVANYLILVDPLCDFVPKPPRK